MTSAQRTHLRERRVTLTDEAAFTLVELLVVVLILAVLVGLAVPAYLNFQGKSQSTAAAADVREVISDANAYYVNNGNSYTGMTAGSLRSTYDSGLVISSSGSTGIVSAKSEGSGQTYCISAVSGGRWAHYSGPGGAVVADPSTVTANPCT
jgi:prepilin-type N-terminal cleavage/methylation domain-containing protein